MFPPSALLVHWRWDNPPFLRRSHILIRASVCTCTIFNEFAMCKRCWIYRGVGAPTIWMVTLLVGVLVAVMQLKLWNPKGRGGHAQQFLGNIIWALMWLFPLLSPLLPADDWDPGWKTETVPAKQWGPPHLWCWRRRTLSCTISANCCYRQLECHLSGMV